MAGFPKTYGRSEYIDEYGTRYGNENRYGYDMVRGRFYITDNTQGVWAVLEPQFSQMSFKWANELAELMRENVRPGIGPGPHPHPGRNDTGHAAAAITVRELQPTSVMQAKAMREVVSHTARWAAGVFSDGGGTLVGKGTSPYEYLSYLEMGWTTKRGRFVRYPWAAPAIEEMKGKLTQFALIPKLSYLGFRWNKGGTFTGLRWRF